MTREQEKELLPIRQAFVDGKSVQVCLKGDGQWYDLTGDCPNFENLCWKWRVKPEPREFWLVGHKHDKTMPWVVYTEQPRASDPSTQHAYEIIHVREVLE